MNLERQIKKITGWDVCVREFEEIKKSDRVNSAGRACYVERNQWMVDDSEYVLLYFDKQEGGTMTVYKYAKTQNKCILNIVYDSF